MEITVWGLGGQEIHSPGFMALHFVVDMVNDIGLPQAVLKASLFDLQLPAGVNDFKGWRFKHRVRG